MPRRTRIGWTLALLALAVPGRGQEAGSGADPAGELASALEALVDLPTPSARAREAGALARRYGRDLDRLRAALASFGRFAPLPAGRAVETVALGVDGKVEETEIAVYVPRGYEPGTPAPLLLAFHGTGGRGPGVLGMWRAVADEVGMIVVAPSEAGPNEGYRFSDRERGSALATMRWIRRRANVDENRVFLTGVSRGGHLAWDLALRHPDRFAGIAPMIGGPRLSLRGGQNNLRYLENVAHLTIRDLQGAEDDPGLVFNVRLAFEELLKHRARDAELFIHEGLGHAFDAGVVDWAELFRAKRRDPDPDRVVRRVARKGEGRAAWVDVLATSSKVKETFAPELGSGELGRLDDAGRRRLLHEAANERTARVEVLRVGNRYRVRAREVERLRLLLVSGSWDPDAPVVVDRGDGEETKKRARASAKLLLGEFAERFDRTFLPLASIDLRL